MERITTRNLSALLERMVRTIGAPTGKPWIPREDGKGMKARVGALVLQTGSATYGNAWTISELVNEAGGERTLIRGSTARELWDAAQAWLDGYEAAKRSA